VTSIDRINAILSESIGLGIGLAGHCGAVKQKLRQPPVLTPDPYVIRVSVNGINFVIRRDSSWNSLNISILERIEPTLRWGEPETTLRISINRSIAFESRIDGSGIGEKCTVANAAESLGTSDPKIAFAILE
jgi:hypothetical protein